MPYRTACKFFRDNDAEDEVRWVEARPDAPVLPFPSIILNSFNERDKELWEGVGEVWGAPRPYTGQRAPRGLDGAHVCGTPADFAEGGTFNEDLPEVKYDANGFALCCGGPKRVNGGAGAGGVTHPVFVDPSPTPGVDCPSAPSVLLNITYGITSPGGTEQWFRWDNLPAGTYHLDIANVGGSSFGWQLRAGVDCASSSGIETGTTPDCRTFPIGATLNVWLVGESVPLGQQYTFKISPGPC